MPGFSTVSRFGAELVFDDALVCEIRRSSTRAASTTVPSEDRWTETPPFGGQFDEVVPHLTIAQV
ncbi:hypothetical protein [Streptomyces sviceus]|uniref:hypothetical protein n=1 Tax=Streptomyces sviceus TaxID=285530 RepID=UPI0036E974E7